METLRVFGQVAMTWWVSATVLCATIIGISWARRAEIRHAGMWAINGLFGIAAVFFLSICSFGVAAIWGIWKLGRALIEACSLSAGRVCVASDAIALRSTLAIGTAIGTTSFILFFMAWCAAWVHTLREGKTAPPEALTVSIGPAESGAIAEGGPRVEGS